MHGVPSAEALTEALRGRIYCAASGAASEAAEVVGWSGTDRAPRGVSVSSGGVVVETSLGEAYPPEFLVTRIVLDAIARTTPTFPLTLEVDRSTRRIPVDGRERVFTVYACRDSVGGAARVRRVNLSFTCSPASLHEGLAIRSISETELEGLLSALQDRLASAGDALLAPPP